MSVARVKEMFAQMVLKKDGSAIERYYAPTFELISNGARQSYEDFAAGHLRVYATDIQYRIEYDDEAWVEADDRVAGRIWITTGLEGAEQTRMEIILIIQFEGDRITRIWETTAPDWQGLEELENYDPE